MVKLNKKPKTQSTLLIPDRFFEDFLWNCEREGKEEYFHSLVMKFRPLVLSGALGKRENIKLKFQKQDENLIRKNFRPRNEDWIEFGLLADYLGFTKTALFSLLLKLDVAGWTSVLAAAGCDNWGVPPDYRAISSEIVLTYRFSPLIFRRIRFINRP